MSKNAPPSEKNKKIWSSNLVRFQKGMTSRKHATVDSLDEMRKLPMEQHILDRYKTLASDVKSRKERIVLIAGEVKLLWKKLNLPIQQGKSTVERKIENVIKKYERHNRRPGNNDFTRMFNVTDEKGEWLCREDREFYELQVSTKGKVGYCTTKKDTKGIHPRKVKLLKGKVSVTEAFAEECSDEICETAALAEECSEEMSETENSVSEDQCSSSSENYKKPSACKRHKTDSAVRLVTIAKLSTRKAHKVCETLSESGVSIHTPTQSGVYKAVMKEGEKLKGILWKT